jgi:hypothetical protein
MAWVATSVQGLRQAVGFFLAYFDYRCDASIGYVCGHFWPSSFPPPTPSSSSTTTSPPAPLPRPRQVYSYNRRRLQPLFTALRHATALEPRQLVPRHGVKFILVPLYTCSVLATPPRAFVPDASPCLASSDRCLVFIGIDNIFFGINNVFFGIDSYDCLDCVTDNSTYVLGSGKTVVCLRPRHAPRSGTPMAAPRPRRLRLHRLRHHHPRRLPSTTSRDLLIASMTTPGAYDIYSPAVILPLAHQYIFAGDKALPPAHKIPVHRRY